MCHCKDELADFNKARSSSRTSKFMGFGFPLCFQSARVFSSFFARARELHDWGLVAGCSPGTGLRRPPPVTRIEEVPKPKVRRRLQMSFFLAATSDLSGPPCTPQRQALTRELEGDTRS